MNIFTPSAQSVILPVLAVVYLAASLVSSHQEVKGHFSFFAKLIIGFCIGAFAADVIGYIATGRSTSLSSLTGSYGSTQGMSLGSQSGISGQSSGMPWDSALEGIYQDLAKYVVIVVGGIAFIIGGIVYMYGIGSRAMHLGNSEMTGADRKRFEDWQHDLDQQASMIIGIGVTDGWIQAARHFLRKWRS